MDGKTGQIVYAYHPNQKRLVASTAKLMTLYLVDKKLSHHPKAWHQKIRISRPLVAWATILNLTRFTSKPIKNTESVTLQSHVYRFG
ncbi:MAG: Hypothetical protein AJITA_01327 [Acetilactobacillus jinshanensis]